LGELPGLVGLALFLDQVTETIRHPGLGSILLLIVIAVGIVLIAWALGRWLSNRPDDVPNAERTA
jgi:phospholipase D1/2